SAEVSVATVDGEIAGYVVVRPGDRELLENVAVAQGHQGRGIGRALIDHVEKRAKERGATYVELYTHELMTENRQLYTRLGYREFGFIVEDGFRRVLMEKRLAVMPSQVVQPGDGWKATEC